MEKNSNLTKKIKPIKKPSKSKIICAFLLLAFGAITISSGFLLSNYIQQRIDDGIKEQIEVPHPHDSKFEEWKSNNYDDAPEMYKTFYLWNLTNLDDFLAGDKPIYEEIGPFTFRQFDYKYDIKFSDNKEEVSFNKFSDYVQVAGENISKIKITNINPAYLGARKTAGGTDLDFIKLRFPMVLTTVKQTFEMEYDNTFAAKVNRLLVIPNITNVNYIKNNVTAVIGSVVNLNSSDNSYLEFASNKTSLSVDFVFRINSSKTLEPFNLKIELSANKTVQNLKFYIYNFSSKIFNLFNTKTNIGPTDSGYNINIPRSTEYSNQTTEESTVILRIVGSNSTYSSDYRLRIDCLNLTLVQPQFDSLITAIYDLGYPFPSGEEVFFEEWANDYFPAPNRSLVPPSLNNTAFINLIRTIGSDTVDTEGSVTGEGVDIDGRDPYLYPGSYADLNISRYFNTANQPVNPYNNITYIKCLKLWDKTNPNSLTGLDYEENKIWYEAVEGNVISKSTLINSFNLNTTQIGSILTWINVSINMWSKNVGQYTLTKEWNSGFITTRTVEEWLFTANDTAIYNHQVYFNKDVSLSLVGIFDDCENKVDADITGVDRFKINTGRIDASKIYKTIEFNGQDAIYIWAEPEEIEGTDGTQFAPGVSEDDTLKTFQPDLMRVVELEYKKETEIYDIKLLRFKLDEDTFSVNPNYYMYTNGLVNLESLEKYHGVSVKVSKPHFLGVDNSIRSAVIGMNPKDEHDTYIDVEPITGIVMNARNRIQVNFEVKPTEIYQTNITQTVMPIVWYEQKGEIPEDLAEEFKDLVYSALELKQNAPFIALGLGAAIFTPGAILITSQIKKHRIIKKSRIATTDYLSKQKVEVIKEKLDLNDQELKSSDNNKPNSA